MASARENLAPQTIQRVAKEIKHLVTNPPDGIRYLPQEDEVLTEIHVEIAGPENTPYDGGFFQVKLSLSDGFPHAPPKGVFLTKIFHPNISTSGEICVNTLKKDWSHELGIAHVLQVIRCLLIVPFPESSLNDEAGKLFMESYDEYARRARLWTNIHAPKKSAAKKPELLKLGLKQIGSPVPGSDDDHSASGSKGDATATGDEGLSTSGDGADMLRKATITMTTTSGSGAAPITKKRTSPTSTDALAAAQKKKTSSMKKGIKRL